MISTLLFFKSAQCFLRLRRNRIFSNTFFPYRILLPFSFLHLLNFDFSGNVLIDNLFLNSNYRAKCYVSGSFCNKKNRYLERFFLLQFRNGCVIDIKYSLFRSKGFHNYFDTIIFLICLVLPKIA